MNSPDPVAITCDAFLGGRVKVIQPARGHRSGLDAVLLQALVPAAADGIAVELGAGAGAASFCAAARAPALKVMAVERDAGLAALARRSLALPENAGFAGRVSLQVADVAVARPAREAAGLFDGSADFVLMNPPFATEGSVRASPEPRRRSAHVAAEGTLGAWIRTAAGLLRRGGRLCIVHRADALAEMLALVGRGFGGTALVPVRPRAGEDAIRILLSAVKASRKPLRIRPDLVLHEPDGRWTAEADAILRAGSDIVA
ncbi:tRNA1(Val) (adenine(37)-N6)-methyltransferase [Propylenella binzhouense]|uniref:Methyltransferase n=1 Tax=Propylenella binzhouense TaxID=2555902 RepID=A0A964T795_9HYPH|nr:methyltransferase [Propylenella binzhouense]MYZ49823.1 methyltransferase [Propylenella binzhouense]